MTRILFLCHRYMDVTRGGLAEFLHFLPVALKHYTLDSIIYTPPENKMIAHLMGPHMLPNNIPHYTGPLLKPRFFIIFRISALTESKFISCSTVKISKSSLNLCLR